MKKIIRTILFMFKVFIFSPLLFLYALTSEKKIIRADIDRWRANFRWNKINTLTVFTSLLAEHAEFRNIYYSRIRKGNISAKFVLAFLDIFYRQSPFILLEPTTNIGPGFFIQHGLAVVINAESIGENCWVNQQVTVGYKDAHSGRPKIGDNVQIAAGAKVIGGIKVGSNVKIGANAVVVKNVPDNCTVVGIPARIVRRNGKRVDEPLL